MVVSSVVVSSPTLGWNPPCIFTPGAAEPRKKARPEGDKSDEGQRVGLPDHYCFGYQDQRGYQELPKQQLPGETTPRKASRAERSAGRHPAVFAVSITLSTLAHAPARRQRRLPGAVRVLFGDGLQRHYINIHAYTCHPHAIETECRRGCCSAAAATRLRPAPVRWGTLAP